MKDKSQLCSVLKGKKCCKKNLNTFDFLNKTKKKTKQTTTTQQTQYIMRLPRGGGVYYSRPILGVSVTSRSTHNYLKVQFIHR